MHPIGHFLTTAAASAGLYAATGSAELALGAAAGGFFIDLDHYFDYIVFHRGRDWAPGRFLDCYFNLTFDWVVLPLHSYELMAALAALAFVWPEPWLVGYLIGATLHMGLDLASNHGVVRAIVPFYSFIYRARHGFAKDRLIRSEALAAAEARRA